MTTDLERQFFDTFKIEQIEYTQCPYHKEDKICTYLPYKSKCEGDCNWTAYKEMEEKLKAKEQECEELKIEVEKWESAFTLDTKMLDNAEARANKLEQQLDQLKADNDSLKSELMQIYCYLDADKETIDQLRTENEDLKKSILQACPSCGEEYLNYKGVELYYENNDLKQTLTEIEKLSIQGNVYCIDYNIDDCEKCIKQSDCKTTLFKQILQKISEVIPDEKY